MIPTSFDEFINDPLFGIYLLCLLLVLTLNIFKVILPLNKLRIECGFTFSEIRQEHRAIKEGRKKNDKEDSDSHKVENHKEETEETTADENPRREDAQPAADEDDEEEEDEVSAVLRLRREKWLAQQRRQ